MKTVAIRLACLAIVASLHSYAAYGQAEADTVMARVCQYYRSLQLVEDSILHRVKYRRDHYSSYDLFEMSDEELKTVFRRTRMDTVEEFVVINRVDLSQSHDQEVIDNFFYAIDYNFLKSRDQEYLPFDKFFSGIEHIPDGGTIYYGICPRGDFNVTIEVFALDSPILTMRTARDYRSESYFTPVGTLALRVIIHDCADGSRECRQLYPGTFIATI